MIKKFKAFIIRGNILDLAVGIIIGAAFGKIVDSLVKDILLPPLGIVLGNIDFSNFFIVLKESPQLSGPYPSLAIAQQAGAITLNVGSFINTLISFIIIAVAIFMVVKASNKVSAKIDRGSTTATTKTCTYCYTTIPRQATRCPNCTSDL